MMCSNWMRIWSVVQKKEQKRWVWTAMCRRTRQIVAFVIGNREPCNLSSFLEGDPKEIQTLARPSVIFGRPINTCSRLKPIAVLGRTLGRPRICNDGTTPYANGLVGTCDRRYLFPASDEYHQLVTKWFIVQYNLGLSLTS
jgi:insertion element IS1 protein InsB